MMRLALLLALPVLMPAQQAAPFAPGERVTRVIHVPNTRATLLAELVRGSSVGVSADNVLQAIVLQGKPNDVEGVERVLRELMAQASPGFRDIELTVSVIGASSKPGVFMENPVPQSLGPVVKQLQAIFPYQTYTALSTMLLRSREGTQAHNDGVMQGPAVGQSPSNPTSYAIHYDEASISADQRPISIHLRNFGFRARPSGGTTDINLNSDVDLRDGQKVVVGKANVENSDSAMFVVLTARLVD